MIHPTTSCSTGCTAQSTGTRLQLSAGQRLEGIDFTVRPWGKVRGRLIDKSTGGPATLAGASMRLRGGRTSSLLSDHEFTFPLSDGVHTLYLEPEYRTASYRPTVLGTGLTVPPGETVDIGDVVIEPVGARIEGRVTDASTGAPVAGLALRIVTRGGIGVGRFMTDSYGRYSTQPLLAPGEYFVQTAGVSAWFHEMSLVQLAGLDAKRVDLQVRPFASIVGLVADAATREPLEGVQLELRYADGQGDAAKVSDTNARGRYDAPAVHPGSYVLTATRRGWRTISIPVTIPAYGVRSEQHLAMEPECGLTDAPPVIDVAATGGISSIPLDDTCSRCAFSSSTFIHVARACGTGEVTYRVEPNLTGEKREGKIVLPGQVIVVRQSKR